MANNLSTAQKADKLHSSKYNGKELHQSLMKDHHQHPHSRKPEIYNEKNKE